MAWSKLEDTFHDDPKFRRLSELLGLGNRTGELRGIVIAQGFLARLWSWASRHAPDGYLPEDSVSTADIERICGWPTAEGRLLSGMIAANFLDKTADGPRRGHIIHRYWERAESYKAAQRKKKQREEEIDVTGQSRPPSEPRHETVSLRGEERTEKRGEDREEIARAQPKDSKQGKPMAPFVLAEFNRVAVETGRPTSENWDQQDTWDASKIYAKYPTRWQQVVRKYLADPFYERWGWSIGYLAKNLDAIANRKQPDEVIPGKRAEIRDWAEMKAEREAQWQRELDEENARIARGETP